MPSAAAAKATRRRAASAPSIVLWSACRTEPDLPAYRTKCHLVLSFDARPWLSELTCPTLIVGGRVDLVVPSAAGRTLAQRIASAELHQLAGEAAKRLNEDENLKFLSRVFWFSLEFGTVIEDGELRAYGAGILSSYGEIEEFRGMDHRALDLIEMGTADYDITAYQPVLYRADSIQQVVDVVGGFFRKCTDESVAEMRVGAKASIR